MVLSLRAGTYPSNDGHDMVVDRVQVWWIAYTSVNGTRHSWYAEFWTEVRGDPEWRWNRGRSLT